MVFLKICTQENMGYYIGDNAVRTRKSNRDVVELVWYVNRYNNQLSKAHHTNTAAPTHTAK